jgi:mannose-6-phosphate isomerase-like protein (cupin superfamily)
MRSELNKERNWVIVKPWEQKGERVPKPYERTLKTLLSPENTGSNRLTLLFAIITPGSSSPWHDHENSETMYITSGHGHGRIDDHQFEIEPDMVVFAAPHVKHQLVNTGDETMKVLCIHIPPVSNKYTQDMIRQAQNDSRENAKKAF